MKSTNVYNRRLKHIAVICACATLIIFIWYKGAAREVEVAVPSLDSVVIDVYYESLCPDSKSFVLSQLKSAVRELATITTVNLVPYGKATTHVSKETSRLNFECQHGESECLGNKAHACGIHYAKNQGIQIDYVVCLFEQTGYFFADFFSYAEQCAHMVHIPSEKVAACMNGTEGDNLLQKFGEQTKALKPSVTYIPTIIINGGIPPESCKQKTYSPK